MLSVAYVTILWRAEVWINFCLMKVASFGRYCTINSMHNPPHAYIEVPLCPINYFMSLSNQFPLVIVKQVPQDFY